MENRTEIRVTIDSIEVAPQNWPIAGQWRVRSWHSSPTASCFGYEICASQEAAHEHAKTIEADIVLGYTSNSQRVNPITGAY